MRTILRPPIIFAFSSTIRIPSRAGSTSVFRSFLSYTSHGIFSDDSNDMAKKDKNAKNAIQLKVPKGTKDWDGRDMVLREEIFSTITEVFKRHGAQTLDTPVFELKEILTGKYGEDSKLIYDLQDQGGELCSLRYDLTVPFARWMAMNSSVQSIKRYHIAKVYRRDQPAMTKGRMREFYQCDFDIAGTFDPMIPDAEIIKIITEVFEDLGWNNRYTVKINHRKILDGIFQVCGVPQDKLRTISSAVDKLDKSPWEEVRQEMTEVKGLDGAVADKIGEYVRLKGSLDLLSKLEADAALSANPSAAQGIKDMKVLFRYLQIFKILDRVSLDMSLARGLDYYTGVIYEVVTEGSAPQSTSPEAQKLQQAAKRVTTQGNVDPDEDRSADPSVGVGSVAAGGRYDELVGMFSSRNNIPCVGISFGVERIFSIEKARREKEASRLTKTDVFIMAFGDGLLEERMKIATTLWDAKINAEFAYKVKPKLPQQFAQAERSDVPFAVILGKDELDAGKVKIKQLGLEDGHPEKAGVDVDMDELVPELRRRIAAWETDKKAAKNGVSGNGVHEATEGIERTSL